MSDPKALMFETFLAAKGRQGQGGFGPARLFLNELVEKEPVAVSAEVHTHYKHPESALRSAARTAWGPGASSLRLRTIDGVLYACLMPESENGS